jgi:hypothetical protein
MSESSLSRSGLESLRHHLSDREKFRELSAKFIRATVENDDSTDSFFKKYYEGTLEAITLENSNEVFAAAESPIERTFLNSLLLTFIKNDGLGLLVYPTFDDAPAEIDRFLRLLNNFRDFVAWWRKNASSSSMETFLDGEVQRGAMCQDERDRMAWWIFRYGYVSLEDSYHLTLQPRFPNIKVSGKGIRTDMYFWIPTRPEIKIIVECDGFDYHSDRERFKSDRQRDRALKAAGYDVLRFSGSEIFNDPINAPHQLAEYLWDRAGMRDDPT